MSRMNGGIVPGQVPLLGQQKQVTSIPVMTQQTSRPLSYPTSIVLPQPNGIPALVVTDGLTKLEHGALQIAASVLGSQSCDAAWDEEHISIMATSLAHSVLDECAKRQALQPQPEPAT